VEPVVVIAHARSGSNCLVELISLALPRPLLNEPFNERHHLWGPQNVDWLSRVHDPASLDLVLDEIFGSWAGLKVLGYQLPPPLLAHLLHRDDVRVVRLRRRNLLEAAVSCLVALQVNLWKTWDHDGPLEERYRALTSLSLDATRDQLDALRHEAATFDEILDRRRGPTLRLGYEELYLSDTDASLTSLWSFLGVDAPTDARVAYYLDPAEVQMGGPDTYGRVPNIAEIEAALGSDDVGHLTYL
jgi:LPS sulfotransferase NodH